MLREMSCWQVLHQDALRGVAVGRHLLSRNIHKEAKIGQTPADSISGCLKTIYHVGMVLFFPPTLFNKRFLCIQT